MPTVDVEFMLPTRARARAKPSGKWHEGVLLVPFTVALDDVEADVVGGMAWGSDRFGGDGENVYALVPTHKKVDDLGCRPEYHLEFPVVTAGVVPSGSLPPAVRDALTVPIGWGAFKRFMNLAHGAIHHKGTGTVPAYEKGLAYKRPEGEVEVDPLDGPALTALLREHLAVDREGRLISRVVRVEAALTTGFRIIPVTGDTGSEDELLRLPLDADGIEAVRVAMGDDPLPAYAAFPTGSCPEAADTAGGLGRRPDVEARKSLVRRFGDDLVNFPDHARDAYTPLRLAIEGSNDALGTEALVELLEVWTPYLAPVRRSECDLFLAAARHLEATLAPREDVQAAFNAF